MIRDAKLGKFDLIITKSVSRFARNTVDCLTLSRELKLKGVHIIFLTDRINTQDADYEPRLAEKAKDAQEYSRVTSENVSWGIEEAMRSGVIFGSLFFGYDRIDKDNLVINEEEAETVRMIFRWYLEGMGTFQIARQLEIKGRKTKRGQLKWHPSGVLKILKNEKYAGVLVSWKYVTPDYLTHERKPNEGEQNQFEFDARIPAIIDLQEFQEVQEKMKARVKANGRGRYSNRHSFSSRICCSECGTNFQCVYQGGVRYWKCGTRTKYGEKHKLPDGREVGCNKKGLFRESIFESIVLQLFKYLVQDRERIRKIAISNAMSILDISKNEVSNDKEKIEKRIVGIQNQKAKMIDLCCKGVVSDSDLKQMIDRYEQEIIELRETMKNVKADSQSSHIDIEETKRLIIQHIDKILSFEEFNEEICKTMVRKITVIDRTHFEIYIQGIFGEDVKLNAFPTKMDKLFFCEKSTNESHILFASNYLAKIKADVNLRHQVRVHICSSYNRAIFNTNSVFEETYTFNCLPEVSVKNGHVHRSRYESVKVNAIMEFI